MCMCFAMCVLVGLVDAMDLLMQWLLCICTLFPRVRLVNEINTKSPAAASKPPASAAVNTPAAGPSGGRRDSGKRKGKPAELDTPPGAPGGGRDSGKGQTGETVEGGREDGDGYEGARLSVTPSRGTPSLVPHAIAMATNSTPLSSSVVAAMDIDPVPMAGIPMDTGCEPMELGGEIAINTAVDSALSRTLQTFSEVPPLLRRALNLSDASHDRTPSTDIPSTSKSCRAVRIKQERADTPADQSDVVVKQEEPIAVKQEHSGAELEAALVDFCAEALGRGVLSLREVQDQLLLKQTSISPGHALWEQGVSAAQLESALRLCGAVEVGQPLEMRLFALTHGEKVSM